MTVRRGTAADLPAVLELVGVCVDAPRWPPSAWKDLLGGTTDESPGQARLVLILPDSARVLRGILVATSVVGITELESVLVRPESRRQGVGRALLEAWLASAATAAAVGAQLEVRESNLPARELYGRLGFLVQGRRASYYHHPVEDALLMGRQLGPA